MCLAVCEWSLVLIYVVILRNNDQVSVKQGFSEFISCLDPSDTSSVFLPAFPSRSILRCSEYFGISRFLLMSFSPQTVAISWDGMARSVFNRPGCVNSCL